jgi:hypothetical protein
MRRLPVSFQRISAQSIPKGGSRLAVVRPLAVASSASANQLRSFHTPISPNRFPQLNTPFCQQQAHHQGQQQLHQRRSYTSYHELPDEIQMIRESARQFCEEEIYPQAAKNDALHLYPKDNIKTMGELGFLGINVGYL